jgi:hypothetical protein
MPSSWRPRERTRLTCSTGGDVVADIGCRRDVLTCPIVSALPVLPLPPPALPSGSNGASPASTWPIPQTKRRPQSIVLRFFRNPQQDGACARGRNGGNAPCLSGDMSTPPVLLFASLEPPACQFQYPDLSFDTGRPHHPTNRFQLKPANQTIDWSNDLCGAIGFPGPLVPCPTRGASFSWVLTNGVFLGCTRTSTINTTCPAFLSSPRHKSFACASVCFGEKPSAAASAVPA